MREVKVKTVALTDEKQNNLLYFSSFIKNWGHSIVSPYVAVFRIHQTLRVTPAMEAKITDHSWSIDEILGLS